jgi:hypothetical protein
MRRRFRQLRVVPILRREGFFGNASPESFPVRPSPLPFCPESDLQASSGSLAKLTETLRYDMGVR